MKNALRFIEPEDGLVALSALAQESARADQLRSQGDDSVGQSFFQRHHSAVILTPVTDDGGGLFRYIEIGPAGAKFRG
jgi:hypothetical protein